MDIYFARQAIYNNKKDTIAYEIIFDDPIVKESRSKVDEEELIKLISNCGSVGLDRFTNNKKAFIEFSELALIEDLPALLGANITVALLDGTIQLKNEAIEAIESLRNSGFEIALININQDTDFSFLGTRVDIYRIDFKETNEEERNIIIEKIRNINKSAKFLAYNVNNEIEYNEAISKFDYFEGQFFSRPVAIHNKDICIRNVNRFNIILQLLNDEFDVDRVENIIKADLSISYRLIRFLNSATFAFVQNITSIKQAIMLLGKEELKRWLTLVVMSEMQADDNDEVINSTIIRARLCELIAEKINKEKSSLAFFVGLFSNLDYLINRNMREIVKELSVDQEIKFALIGKENMLRDILMLVKAYEEMDKEKIDYYATKTKIDKQLLFNLYLQAVEWLNQIVVNFE